MSEVFYYKVAVCLNPTWKENVFTYHSGLKLSRGTVVDAPFGKSFKKGVVVASVSKPNIETKEIIPLDDNVKLPELTLNLLSWVNTAYPGMPGFHTQLVLPNAMKTTQPQQEKTQIEHEPQLPPLTTQQQEAISQLTQDTKPSILHGITGSGKTRVYQELAKQTLEAGKNVLVLYPEISLTPHMEKAFSELVGPSQLHVYHSKNTPKQQRETWHAALRSEGGHVFIGPRSALFLPLKNLGLVVVDEAHDSSYKQDSGSHYNGLIVAGALAKLSGAKLVFGSATPPIQETHYILERGGSMVCMHSLAKPDTYDKDFTRIDMTDASIRHSSSYMLSRPLIEAVQDALDDKKQSLLFLNRRGTARSVMCPQCGWHSQCNRCHSPTTYHHDVHQLICHMCGLRQKTVTACPDCGQAIQLKSPGTKAIEAELKELFPTAHIMRFDSDNKKAESMAENYDAIRNGDADIILGTQLITKGLDLPNLKTVGIMQADSSLYLPDFSSRERSFQQLTQVSGRVGRGHNHGHVLLQTYNPESLLFDLIQAQDWHTFYKEELENREQAGFPPFRFLMRLWVHKRTDKQAQSAAQTLTEALKKQQGIQLLGPAPSFYPKVAGKYSWQLLVFSKSRTTLSALVKDLPKDTYYDLDPISLL